jgi:hypothetical protein
MKRQCLVILILATCAFVHDARAAETGAAREETPHIMAALLPQLRRFLVAESLRWVEKPLVYRMELAGADPKHAPELYALSTMQWKLGDEAQLGVGVPVGFDPGVHASVMLAIRVRF